MRRLLPAILLLILAACDEAVEPPVLTIHPDNVNITRPADGQRSYYLRYEGSCDSPVNTSYTGDTLLLEISKEGDKWYMHESFTPGSPLYKQNASVVSYEFTNMPDYLLLKDRLSSALFFFYGNDTLRTQVNDQVNLRQSGCRIRFGNDIFIGNEIGRINDFRVGDIWRNDLTAVSCVPMVLDLDAYLMYDKYLHVSHMVSDADNINGWVLSGI